MSLPNSENQAIAYIADRPDFGERISYTSDWLTPISTQRNGTEQRTQKRQDPFYGQRFILSALDVRELSVRRAAEVREAGRPVCVPQWKYWFQFASLVSNVLTVTGDLSRSRFKVGSRVFIRNGSTWNFSKITAKGASTLTLDLAENFPAIMSIYTTAAKVYPCIVGMRPDNQTSETTMNRLDDSDVAVQIDEL